MNHFFVFGVIMHRCMIHNLSRSTGLATNAMSLTTLTLPNPPEVSGAYPTTAPPSLRRNLSSSDEVSGRHVRTGEARDCIFLGVVPTR